MATKERSATIAAGEPLSWEAFELQRIAIHDVGKTQPLALHEWLMHDTWRRDEGLPLLLGLDPRPSRDFLARCVQTEPGSGALRTARILSARRLDGSLVCLKGYSNVQAWDADGRGTDAGDLPLTSFDLLDFEIHLRALEELWDSGQHPERNPPRYFVDWAKRKGRAVEWEHWAIDEGLLPEGEADKDTPESRLALYRKLGGEVAGRPGEWEFPDIGKLEKHLRASGASRCSQKPIRADLREALKREREEQREGVLSRARWPGT